jgi:hypothetical protein
VTEGAASHGLIIRLIIQTIRQDPSGSVWTDEAPNVNRPDPSGADQTDVDHQPTDLAVGARARLEPRQLIPVAGGSRPLQAQRLDPVHQALERRLVLDRAIQHRRHRLHGGRQALERDQQEVAQAALMRIS